MRIIRHSRWHLQDPISVGFQRLIQTEKRMARWRSFKVKARFAATMIVIVVAQVGCLIGLFGLLDWIRA